MTLGELSDLLRLRAPAGSVEDKAADALETLRRQLEEKEAQLGEVADRAMVKAEEFGKQLTAAQNNYESAMQMAEEFKGLAKDRLDALAAAHERIADLESQYESRKFAQRQAETDRSDAVNSLAAAQLQIKTLRLALQTYIDEHEECQDADDWMAMMCSIEAHHVADEALSLPQDLSALHSYGKRIADEVERRTVERCAKAVWNAKPSQKAIDEIPAAYQLASLSAIRALPLGQIDVEELGK